jgi:hypothetical protein
VFHLPYNLTLAPIFDYDYNGDGKNSDRPAGVAKFSENGPKFAAVNLRLTYGLPLGSRVKADLIAEFFNLLNRVNYDVNSIQNGEFLSGPTLANPALPAVPNPRFRQYTSTLPPFESQLGLRVLF